MIQSPVHGLADSRISVVIDGVRDRSPENMATRHIKYLKEFFFLLMGRSSFFFLFFNCLAILLP